MVHLCKVLPGIDKYFDVLHHTVLKTTSADESAIKVIFSCRYLLN